MCSTVADTAILYSVIAGRDEKCPVGLEQPKPSLSNVSNLSIFLHKRSKTELALVVMFEICSDRAV